MREAVNIFDVDLLLALRADKQYGKHTNNATVFSLISRINLTTVDVYNDSPTLITIWLTIMPKISILIFLLQLLIGIDVYLNLNIYNILNKV